MTHTPVVTSSLLEYYEFNMNGMAGPQQYPTVDLPNFSGEKIKERIAQLTEFGFSIKSVTAIHQGVLDYMGDNMSVGGTSPTCGIVVNWESICCSERKASNRLMMQDEHLKNPEMWLAWSESYRKCGELKIAISILKIAQTRFPDYSDIIYFLACFSCNQGDFVAAKDYLQKAIQMNAKFEEKAKTDMDLFPLFILEK